MEHLQQNTTALRLKSAEPSSAPTGEDLGRKTITVPMRTKVLDSAKGECEHVVSVFGVVDYGGDRILPGFFAKSIAQKLPKGVWCHDWTIPVAKTLEAVECMPGDERLPEEIREFGGLYVKAQYNLETQRGREAFSDVAGGYMDEFSIGFTVEKEAKDKKTGVNNLIEGRIFEWSPVLWGMNPMTRHIAAKDRASLPTASQATLPTTKDAEGAWAALRAKSFDDKLPLQMTWGAVSRAVDCLWSECFDAVWGYGEFRELDTTSRAAKLQETCNTFAVMVVGAYLTLMQALESMDEQEDSAEEGEDDALALKMQASLALLKALPEADVERALAGLIASGRKSDAAALSESLSPSDPAPSPLSSAVDSLTALALVKARAQAALVLSATAEDHTSA